MRVVLPRRRSVLRSAHVPPSPVNFAQSLLTMWVRVVLVLAFGEI
jgi:hypothetical protein